MTDIRVTQVAVEEWGLVSTANTYMLVTQVAAEMWGPLPSAPAQATCVQIIVG